MRGTLAGSIASLALWTVLAAPRVSAAPALVVLNAQGVSSVYYCGPYSIRGTGFPANASGKLEMYQNGGLQQTATVQTDSAGTFSFAANTGQLLLTYLATALPRFSGVSANSATFYMACTLPTIAILQQGIATNQVCGNVTLRLQNFAQMASVSMHVKLPSTSDIALATTLVMPAATGSGARPVIWQADWTTPSGVTTADASVSAFDGLGNPLAAATLLIRCGSTAPAPTTASTPGVASPVPTATAASNRPTATASATGTATSPPTAAGSSAAVSPDAARTDSATAPSPSPKTPKALVDAANALVANDSARVAGLGLLAFLGVAIVSFIVRRVM